MTTGVKRPGVTLCKPRARLTRIKAVTSGYFLQRLFFRWPGVRAQEPEDVRVLTRPAQGVNPAQVSD